MLLVRTTVQPSSIAGLGLFAAEAIPAGATVWSYMVGWDRTFTADEGSALPPVAQSAVFKYAYFDAPRGQYLLCGDDARFFNHADVPNCDDSGTDITVAARDIEIGEELTVNYWMFYGDLDAHPEVPISLRERSGAMPAQ